MASILSASFYRIGATSRRSADSMMRIATKTISDVRHITYSVMNFPPMGEIVSLSNEPKVGMVGYMVGIPIGMVFYVLRYIGNTLWHSFRTTARMLAYFYCWSRGDSIHALGIEQDEFDTYFGEEDRTLFQQYGFGVFALFFMIPALILPFSVILMRIVAFNLYTFVKGFQLAFNLLLLKPYFNQVHVIFNLKARQLGNLELSNRTLKYAKGLVGGIGLTAGFLGGSILFVLPLSILHIWESFNFLALSLLNVGLQVPYFERTMGADNRPILLKILGSLGYVLALCTVGLVPLAFFLIKGICLTIGILVSPIVACLKWIAIKQNPRFDSQRANDDLIMRRCKNVFTALGKNQDKIPIEGLDISVDENGGMGLLSFARKSSFFNRHYSLEQMCANALLKHIQTKGQITFEFAEEDTIIDAIKSEVLYGSFFFTEAARKMHEEKLLRKIRAVFGYLKNLITDGAATVTEPVVWNEKLTCRELWKYTITQTSEMNFALYGKPKTASPTRVSFKIPEGEDNVGMLSV